MTEFDESKHPRNEDGKFTDKGGTYRQNESYESILMRQKKLGKETEINTLTKKEWALFYKALAEKKLLGYWKNKTRKGETVVVIDEGKVKKIIIAGGTFNKPKVKFAFDVPDEEQLMEILEGLK